MAGIRVFPSCGEGRLVWLCLAVALLSGACREQARPLAPATRPVPPASQGGPGAPASQTQPAARSQAAERPRHFELTEPGPILPGHVSSGDRPFTILAKDEPNRPARLSATLQSDTLMTISTENVAALRLDLANLPERSATRLVLHIDGQGLEVTGKGSQIIYLRRSRVGEWTFARPTEPGRR